MANNQACFFTKYKHGFDKIFFEDSLNCLNGYVFNAYHNYLTPADWPYVPGLPHTVGIRIVGTSE